MSQVPLAPPPQTGQPIDSWLYLLWRRLTATGQMLWSSIVPGSSADVAAVVTDKTGSPGSLVFSGNPTLAGITDSGNLTFTGTANRIIGDLSNATIANRVIWQTSTINGNTFVPAMPNGTGTIAGFGFYNSSDPDNASLLSLSIQSAQAAIASTKTGSGAYQDLNLQTSGATKATIDVNGVVTLGGGKDTPALKVTPVASQARWIEVTGATSSGNPTLGVSGGIFAISASVAITGVVSTSGYTVATLPAGTVGQRAYVTDALAPAYGVAVAGAGAVTIPVFYNGAAWICA